MDLEQEAVELRLGQRVGAFLVDRVLGREHEEGLVELELVVADRDALLLHRLEQRGLGLGRGAVDLVREHDVGEDRALEELEHPRLGHRVLLQDLGADDVRGHQVGGELDALEGEVQGARQGRDEQGLGQAGHALEHAVAAREDRDQQLLDDLVLADDDLGELAADRLEGLLALGHQLLVVHGGGTLSGFRDAAGGGLGIGHERSWETGSRKSLRHDRPQRRRFLVVGRADLRRATGNDARMWM